MRSINARGSRGHGVSPRIDPVTSPRGVRRLLVALWIWVLPLVAPWALLLALNAASSTPLVRARIPEEPRVADRCTWSCHNHGCRHRPALPALLSGDRGLHGLTIRALFSVGRGLSRDRALGYGAANLLLLCVAWPGLMYALWVVAWRQRLALRAARAKEGA